MDEWGDAVTLAAGELIESGWARYANSLRDLEREDPRAARDLAVRLLHNPDAAPGEVFREFFKKEPPAPAGTATQDLDRQGPVPRGQTKEEGRSSVVLRSLILGTVLGYLTPYSDEHYTGQLLNENLRALRDFARDLRLTDTVSATFGDLHLLLAGLQPHDRLTLDGRERLRRLVQEVSRVATREASRATAILPGDRRYEARRLLSDVPTLVGRGFDWLPDVAQHDFREAGRCLALALPTASAFHLMRGTEGALRHFYLKTVRRNRIKVLTWGPMVTALRARRRPPPAPLLDHLDSIRRNFRNPTQHPDKIYTLEEVEDLWGVCVDVVNRMAEADSQRETSRKAKG